MTRFYVNAFIALVLGLIFGWPWGAGYFLGFLVYLALPWE